MPYETKAEIGQHNVVCAICQSYFKSGVMRRDWQGLMLCPKDWEPRPDWYLDPIRIRKEKAPPKEIQPPQPLRFKDDV